MSPGPLSCRLIRAATVCSFLLVKIYSRSSESLISPKAEPKKLRKAQTYVSSITNSQNIQAKKCLSDNSE